VDNKIETGQELQEIEKEPSFPDIGDDLPDEAPGAFPNDPPWLSRYLSALTLGHNEEESSLLAGRSPVTTWRWRTEAVANAKRHTRARLLGTPKRLAKFRQLLREGADKLIPWFVARQAACDCPDEWKRINKNLRDAEPDMISQHRTEGTALSLVDLLRDSDNGGFRNHGGNGDSASDNADPAKP
jgi:hypothetical protein